jgi:hypothetical protein
LNPKEKNLATKQSVPFLVNGNSEKLKNETKRGVNQSKTSKVDIPNITNADDHGAEQIIDAVKPGTRAQTANIDSSVVANYENVVKGSKVTGSEISTSAKIKTANDKKSNKLRLGFSVGAGGSDIRENTSRTYSYPASMTGGGTPSAYGNPSSIQTGISFYGGAFLEKSLSRKLSLSLGLNYRYHSTGIHTGKQGDSVVYIYTANSFNLSSPAPVAQNNYYRSGTSLNYTNQYHFIELPVLLNVQLNQNAKLPLVWHAGFSFSYLIYTNALQFDPATDVYYKDNSYFNRPGFNLMTGFAIGLYHKKNFLQLGPEIEYGATKVLHKNVYPQEHFIYGGLKFSFIFQKK